MKARPLSASTPSEATEPEPNVQVKPVSATTVYVSACGGIHIAARHLENWLPALAHASRGDFYAPGSFAASSMNTDAQP